MGDKTQPSQDIQIYDFRYSLNFSHTGKLRVLCYCTSRETYASMCIVGEYGYSGNLHFCISWLLCVQRDKLSKMAHRKAHQTGWCCIIPCAWEWEWGTCKAGASLSLLLGPQITEAEGDGQGGVGMMWPQVDTQSRWQVWGNEKEREHALMVAVTTAITDWALIPCQELF